VSRAKIIIITPAIVVFAGFCFVLSLFYIGSWLSGMHEHLLLDSQAVSNTELNAQLKAIERRLAANEDARQVMILPEGELFANSFYGYSLINMSLSRPFDDKFRNHSCSQIEKLLFKIKTMAERHPFSLNANLKPKGGIIFAGHLNLLRAGYVLLGGKRREIIEEFHQNSTKLNEAFLESVVPFPECYPGFTWAEDAIFALESLRLHDVIFRSDYSKARDAWLAWVKNHLDTESGMMVSQVNPQTGNIEDGPRGMALSWALAFLPQLDKEFATLQYARFQRDWFVPFGGMLGINEWYQGKEKPTKFHAGYVVLGLGMAASGIGIATCRANGDYVDWHKLLRSLETFGFPTISISGEKTYFFGQCLLADELALWGKTICRWDRPQANLKSIAPQSRHGYDDFCLSFVLACLLSIVCMWYLARLLIILLNDKTLIRPPWQRVTVIAFVLQLLACAAVLYPAISWIQIIMFMSVLILLEEATIRPRIVTNIFYDSQPE
jgi:hypothetical protein